MVSAPARDETTVRTSVQVACSPDHAFDVFTTGLDRWWNRAHHLLPGTLAEVGVDPFVGGRVWERNDAGETCTWGLVLEWQPSQRFAFEWRIGTDWAPPAEDAPASTVTVTFTQVDGGTLVELTHSDLDRHGDGWQAHRDNIGSGGGWPGLLRLYAGKV